MTSPKDQQTMVQDDSSTNALQEKSPVENKGMGNTRDDHEYPGFWSLMAIMIGVYFAIFIVALVSSATYPPQIMKDIYLLTEMQQLGPNHHCDSHPTYHRRLPCPRRYRVVR